MNEVKVHIYKYSQDARRRMLKKLVKLGFAEFAGRSKYHWHYKILNMPEYVKRKD